MSRSLTILPELEPWSPTLAAADPAKPPFDVPAGYFEGFAASALARIRALSPEELAAYGTGVAAEADDPAGELAALSALLAGASRQMPYAVPDGYFDSLAGKLAAPAVRETPAAPVVAMRRSAAPSFRRWLAVAAVVTGIALTTFFVVNRRNASGDDPNTAIAKVSDQELASFLQDADNTGDPQAATTANATDFNDGDISDLLAGVPDSELASYPLEPTPAAVN